MANSREIIRHRDSVKNIVKITKTMEMISTAKFRTAQEQLHNSQPYSKAITQLVSELIQENSGIDHPLLINNQDVDRSILLVLTSNRGLCGGYNGNVVRATNENLEILRKKEGYKVDLRVSGKKGIARFKFLNEQISASYTNFDEKSTFTEMERLANELILLYSQRRIDAVRIVYTRFYSAALHLPVIKTLLPLQDLA